MTDASVSANISAPAVPEAKPAAKPTSKPTAKRAGWFRRLISWCLRVVFGGFLCLHPIGSLMILGWAQRRAAAKTLSYWHDAAGSAAVIPMPVWFAGGAGSTGWRRWLGGLRENMAVGIATAFNALILILPASTLMLFAWWGGWENSFNKGYEQAWIGPSVSLFGIAWFIPAAIYVIFAQGRQAVAGWRGFFDWGLNLRFMFSRPWQIGVLAVLAAFGALPYTFLRMLPFFFPDSIAAFETLSLEQQQDLALRYSWGTLIYLVAIGLILRQVAARCYGAACLHCLQQGTVSINDLRPREQAALQALNLHQVSLQPPPRWWWRVILGLSHRVQSVVFVIGAMAAWFGVIAQLYIAQFANHAWVLWLNHPLVSFAWVPVPPVQ